MDWNAVDIIVLVVLVLGAIQGLRRGLSGEIAFAVCAVIAFLFGLVCYRTGGEFVADHTLVDPDMADSLAFIVSVVLALGVLLLLRLLVSEAISITVNQSVIDRVGGLFIGMVKWFVIVSALIIALALSGNPWLTQVFAEDSAVGRALMFNMPELRRTMDRVSEDVTMFRGNSRADPDGGSSSPWLSSAEEL